jgi:hypothetical protein
MRRLPVILIVTLLFTAFSFGGADIGFNGIGGKLGFIDPEGDDNSTIAFGAVADLGTFMENLGFEVEAQYWAKKYDVAGFDFTISSFSIAGLTRYYFMPEGEKFRAFGGGGLGLSFNSAKSDWLNPITGQTEKTTSSDTDLSIILEGGGKMSLSDVLDGFATLRYAISGDWDYIGIFGGIIYKLNK